MKTTSSTSVPPDVSPTESTSSLAEDISAEELLQKSATQEGRNELAGLTSAACQRIQARITKKELSLNTGFYRNLVSSNDGLKFLNGIISADAVVKSVDEGGFQLERGDISRLAELEEGSIFFNHVLHSAYGPSVLRVLGPRNERDRLLLDLSRTPLGRLFLCNIDYSEWVKCCDGNLFSPLPQEILGNLLSDAEGVITLSAILTVHKDGGFETIFQRNVRISGAQFNRLLNMAMLPVMDDSTSEYSNDYVLRPAYELIKALHLCQSFDPLVARDARFTTEQFSDFIAATKEHRHRSDFNLISLYDFGDRRQSLLQDVVLNPKTLLARSNLEPSQSMMTEFQKDKFLDSYGTQRFGYLLEAVSGLLPTRLDANYRLKPGEIVAAFRSGRVSDDARWLAALMQDNCLWQVLSPNPPIAVSHESLLNAMSNMTKVQALTGLVETGRGQGIDFPAVVTVPVERLSQLFGHRDEEANVLRNQRPGVRLLSALAHEGLLQLEAPIEQDDFESYFVTPGLYQGFIAAMIGSGRKESLRPQMRAASSPALSYLAHEPRPVGAHSKDFDLHKYLRTEMLLVDPDGRQIMALDPSGFVALAADAEQGNADSARFMHWFLDARAWDVAQIRNNTLSRLNAEGLSALIVFAPTLAQEMLAEGRLNLVGNRAAFSLSRRAMEVVGHWPQQVCENFNPIQLTAMASSLGTHAGLLNVFADKQPQLLERMSVSLLATSPIVGSGTQHYEALTSDALNQLTRQPLSCATFLEGASARQIQAIPREALMGLTAAALSGLTVAEDEQFNPFLRNLTEQQLSAMLEPGHQGALHKGLFIRPPLLSAALINSFHPRELVNALVRNDISDVNEELFERMDTSHRQALADHGIRVLERFVPPPTKRIHATDKA